MPNIGLSNGFPVEVNVTRPYSAKPTAGQMKIMKFRRRRIGSAVELAEVFREGRSCCNMIQDWFYGPDGDLKNSRRRKANWNGSYLVVLDVDGNDTGLSLDEIVEKLPHRPHVAYRTWSCDPSCDNKFRLVYVTDLIREDFTFRCVWWTLDQELRSVTGLTGHVYRDGRVTASDHMLQCPVQVFHGARAGSDVIVGPAAVYRSEELLKNSEIYEKIKSSFSHADFRGVDSLSSRLYINENELLIFPIENQAVNYKLSMTDKILVTDLVQKARMHPESWIDMALSVYGNDLYRRFLISRTDLPDEDRDPACRHIIWIRDPDTYYEMPVWFRNGAPVRLKRGQSLGRVKNLYMDAIRLRMIRPDADFHTVVINLLLRLRTCYDWYNGGVDPVTPANVVNAACHAMDTDPAAVNPDLLFGPCDKAFIVDAWAAAAEEGVELHRPAGFYEMPEEDQKEWIAARRKNLKSAANRLRGLARKLRTDMKIAGVYDPLYNVSWNMSNIEKVSPEVPHCRNRLYRYCEEHGLNPCPVETRGGCREGSGRKTKI